MRQEWVALHPGPLVEILKVDQNARKDVTPYVWFQVFNMVNGKEKDSDEAGSTGEIPMSGGPMDCLEQCLLLLLPGKSIMCSNAPTIWFRRSCCLSTPTHHSSSVFSFFQYKPILIVKSPIKQLVDRAYTY